MFNVKNQQNKNCRVADTRQFAFDCRHGVDNQLRSIIF